MTEQAPAARPARRPVIRVFVRMLTKAWDDSIFSESAEAAFWQVLSLPPLLLGLLGSLAYIAPVFGPELLPTIEHRMVSAADRFFAKSVVEEIIAPTITDIVQGARGEVVSLGFVISLWAGSSAISAFVDSVVEAHDQTPLRHPVRQRFFALFLYVIMLGIAIVVLPLIALGPQKIADFIPPSWDGVLRFGYYPGLFLALVFIVTVLYRVALPRPLPTYRLVLGAVLASTVFLVASFGLRLYLAWITRTGYTYGALAAPIAFLLFAFFLGFAVMIGAELNAAIEEQWPAPRPYVHRLRWWLRTRAEELVRTKGDEGTEPDPNEAPKDDATAGDGATVDKKAPPGHTAAETISPS